MSEKDCLWDYWPLPFVGRHLYYENHQSVKWARITKSLPRPLSLNILMKFLSHGLRWSGRTATMEKTHFQNLTLFSLAIAEKPPTKKPVVSVVKSPPFPIMSCIIFLLKSSPTAFPRSYRHVRSVLPWSNKIPLKDFNHLQAKLGVAQTRKFLLIPQISGFCSRYSWMPSVCFSTQLYHVIYFRLSCYHLTFVKEGSINLAPPLVLFTISRFF